MNEDIKKAMEGLMQNDGGLLETDSLLRDELIIHKLDYLTAVVGSLACLVVEIQRPDPSNGVKDYVERVKRSYARCNKAIAQSIEEYKERGKNVG